MIKIVLAGSVSSSFKTLQKLIEHTCNVVGFFGYEPINTQSVSGYINMKDFCKENEIPYFPFKKIADADIQLTLESLSPDLFFVIGLSQLVPESMLKISKMGNIGFHPTLLPRGRGRAPIAWLILEEKRGAANFFLMGEGADDGPVFVQEPFDVLPSDNALAIEEKIIVSIGIALDRWLPELKKGIWNPITQEEVLATWYGKRSPEDGWINWELSAESIDRLIRASSHPHPGAFTFLKSRKIRVFNTELENGISIKGVTGRVLIVKDDQFLIQTGNGLLWISGIIDEEDQKILLKVGEKLGYYTELEIYKMKNEIIKLKERIG